MNLLRVSCHLVTGDNLTLIMVCLRGLQRHIHIRLGMKNDTQLRITFKALASKHEMSWSRDINWCYFSYMSRWHKWYEYSYRVFLFFIVIRNRKIAKQIKRLFLLLRVVLMGFFPLRNKGCCVWKLCCLKGEMIGCKFETMLHSPTLGIQMLESNKSINNYV